MKHKTRYDGKEKKYEVKAKKKKKLSNVAKILISSILCLILTCLSLSLIIKSMDSDYRNFVNYNEVGNIDYKVYLKENTYYSQKYLEKGSNLTYIASIISNVNVDFNYELHSTNNLDYLYKYQIDAKLIISDKNNNSKILYEKVFNLKKPTTKTGTGNNFNIKDDIDVDYDEYNDYVNSFKRDYGLTVDSNLTLTMTIDVEGEYLEFDKLKKTNTLSVVIPLSEQTINISIKDNGLDNQGIMLNSSNNKAIYKMTYFVLGSILGILDLIALYCLVRYLSKTNKKDLYHSTINKYLKDYDRIIVTTKQPNVDERLFDEIIRVQDIKELVDLHDMSQKPIIYYEVIPNAKSYFIIISDRLLYKLTITKAWLERHNEESKK